MKVKSVIGECLVKMGKTDFSNKTPLTVEETDLMNNLLSALNIAYREAITLYIPLICVEDVTFSQGMVQTVALSRKILYPISLHYHGENVKFREFADRIESNGVSGVATIKYAYTPSGDFSINSEIPDMKLTQSILADGTLAGYYFATKNFELAKNFDTEFRTKLDFLKNKGKRLRIKARGWQD